MNPERATWLVLRLVWGAFAVGIVGLVGGGEVDERLHILMAPAGAVFALFGVVVLTNWRGVRDAMAAKDASRSKHYRRTGSRLNGLVAVIVGVGWVAFGIATAT